MKRNSRGGVKDSWQNKWEKGMGIMPRLYAGDSDPISGRCAIEEEEEEEMLSTSAIIFIKFMFLFPLFI
jgi:hypothetical protein